jgi:hypothetical protein
MANIVVTKDVAGADDHGNLQMTFGDASPSIWEGAA